MLDILYFNKQLKTLFTFWSVMNFHNSTVYGFSVLLPGRAVLIVLKVLENTPDAVLVQNL